MVLGWWDWRYSVGLWCLRLYGLAWEFARFWVLVMRCDISFRFSGFAVGLDFDVFAVVFLGCCFGVCPGVFGLLIFVGGLVILGFGV